MFSSPPDSPPTASSKRSLLPTAVINFNPKKNNTRSDLELSLAAIPTTSCSLYFTKKAHFALNYTEEKDRALIEIPAEVAKTTRRINEDLPPIPNFPLLFWFIQITLTAIGAFFLVAKPDNATAVNVALVSCSVLLVPFFILRSFVNSLVKEIRRLAHLYSETYYLQVRTGGVAWFWAEGGGFFTRGDALVVGLGVGHKILLVTEVEYGAPTISDERSTRKSRREMDMSGVNKVKEDNQMSLMHGQMTTERSKKPPSHAKITPAGGGGKDGGQARQPANPRRARKRGSMPTLGVQ